MTSFTAPDYWQAAHEAERAAHIETIRELDGAREHIRELQRDLAYDVPVRTPDITLAELISDVNGRAS